MLKTNISGNLGWLIVKHTPDDINKELKVIVRKGFIDTENNFSRMADLPDTVSGPDEKTVFIRNIPEHPEFITEQLQVSNGAITTTHTPVAEVTMAYNGSPITDISGLADGEVVDAEYYYSVPAANWFDLATQAQIDAGEVGTTRRDATGAWLWSILVQMGEFSGEVI